MWFFFYLAYFVPLFLWISKALSGGQAAENPLGAVYGDSVFWVVTKGGWPTNGRSLRTSDFIQFSSVKQNMITLVTMPVNRVLICRSFVEAIFKLSFQVENIRILIPVLLELFIWV